jgi:hypothetical protein
MKKDILKPMYDKRKEWQDNYYRYMNSLTEFTSTIELLTKEQLNIIQKRFRQCYERIK